MAECQRCALNAVVSALAVIAETFPRKVKKNGKNEVAFLDHAQLFYRESKKSKVAKCAQLLEPDFKRLRDFVEAKVLLRVRECCRACSLLADDDNPSHQGKTFISLDAQPEGTHLGGAASPQGEEESGDEFFSDMADEAEAPAMSSADYINRNAIRQDSAAGRSVTNLPTHIEDMIGKVLCEFNQLDVFEQNLIIRLMSGLSFVDFGTMNWIPPEMRKPQSKEFVSVRWHKLVKKFPVVAALRRTSAQSKSDRDGGEGGGKAGRKSNPLVQTVLDLSPYGIDLPK